MSGPGRTRIKFCGLRDSAGLAAAIAAGADLVGFVLAPGGPRSLARDAADALLAAVPADVDAVMVLRNQPEALETLPAGVLAQLHGQESEAHCAIAARATGRPVIRAIGWDEQAPALLRRFDACPDVGVVLIDATHPGSGEPIDDAQHAALAAAMRACTTPVGIAGGLDAATVGAIIRRLAPSLVDVSSGIESARGVKDPERMQAFAAAVRAADDVAG